MGLHNTTFLMIKLFKRKLSDWLWRDREKHFTGSVLDRLRGLDPVLASCRDTKVLDVTSSDGLISYEFFRRGAALIHGIERNRFSLRIARYIFADVPIPSRFIEADLAIGSRSLDAAIGSQLLPSYDIVLFLGIYHHLIGQMSAESLEELVKFFMSRSTCWFVVRTDLMEPVAKLAAANGFSLHSVEPKKADIGLLHVYIKS